MSAQCSRRALAALLCCALLLAPLFSALAVDYPCTGFLKEKAPLLRTADEKGAAVCTLPAGDAVYVTGESGAYYIAEYDGQAGYVKKSSVLLSDEDAAPNLPTDVYASRYTSLRQGAQGQAVTDLQKALIELGFLSGEADGKYGTKTDEAVAAFQQKNGLNVSGSADAATQGLLFEGKPLNSRGRSASVSVAPSVEGFPISSGKTGELVERVQTALKGLGYYSGKIDGKCGSGTVSAIRSFQKKNNMTVSGVADAATQALLFGGGALSASATATPKPTQTPVPPVIGWENGVPSDGQQAVYPFVTNTLDSVNLRKKASTSSARLLSIPKGAQVTVEALQGDFAQVSYFNGKKTYSGYAMAQYIDIPEIYFGGDTLKEDPVAQRNYDALSQGAAGDQVAVLQEALRELGFYTAEANGLYDTATYAAVRALQRANGLLQTGIASSELQKLIYEGKPLNSRGKKTAVSVLPPIDGVTIRQGDRGYQVSEVQTQLSSLGYYAFTVSGVCDANTVRAVRAFQKANGLTSDGVVGEKTYAALRRLLATPTPAIPIVTPTPPPVTADNVIIIHRGTRGLAVTRLQERLTALGYYDVQADGVYDANDITAVRAFQKKNGLTVDGVAGLDTQQKLYSDGALPAWATATPKPTSTPAPAATPRVNLNTTLSIGSRGDDVTLLQARLTALKYLTDIIDGRFGTKTAAAVAAFQANNGLTANGVADSGTLKKLYADSAQAAPEDAPATEKPGQSNALLRTGDTGEAVKSIQRMLIELNYLTGAPDGIFGPKTNLAVKAFQRNNRLGVDGIVGAETRARLQTLYEEKQSAQNGGNDAPAADGTVNGADFKAPAPEEVRFANWYTETRAIVRTMPDAIIYDFETGLYYHVNMFSFGKHCDAEPVTASDTAIMRQIMGAENWTPHAVWVVLSDGKVYMASTHSKGHEVDHNPNNDLTGHICIHFPRELSEAEATGPYALSHQYEILDGWERTQNMIALP